MAWATGTATNYIDLLDKVESFLTTNSTLVGLGQNWETLRYAYGVDPVAYSGRIAFGSTTNATTILDSPPAALPASYYKATITGTLTAPLTGSYNFGIDGDDCIDLIIDGNLVAGWYGSHTQLGNYTHFETVTLSAGAHTFSLRFVQAANARAASLGWQKPGDGSIDIIPGSSLSNMTLSWADYASSMPTTTGGMDALFSQKHLLLKAPGISGTDEIFVGIQPFENVTSDYYNWRIMSSLGYNATADFSSQPYKCTNSIIYLWNDPITYWIIANGNRVILIAKIDTIYQIMYLGKFLSYFLPAQYPYPVLCCGTHESESSRWSSYDYNFSSILNPGSGCKMYYIDGLWKTIQNRYAQSGTYVWQNGFVNIWPTGSNNNVLDYSLAWPDGGYTLLPLILEMDMGSHNILGEVDGILWISGHQNSSENIVNVAGQNYLVVQDVWKTARREYMAVRLS